MTHRDKPWFAAWRIAATVLVLAATLAAGLYLWRTSGAYAPPEGPPETLTLAVSTVYGGSSMVLLAQERGYFRAEGLDLQLADFPTGKAALESVLQARADLATAADLPFVFAALQGAPVSIVGTLATSDSGYGVVARKDRGIASPADLRGRRIGLTTGSSAHFWLDAFLLRQHMELADVRVQSVPADRLAASLAAGEVDAVATWNPYLGAAQEALGDKGLLFTGSGIYESPWNLVGRSAELAARSEAIRRLLRALLRAERAYAEDPEASLAAIARVRGIGVAELRTQLADFRFALRLEQSLLGALEDESRWAIRSKVVRADSVPNYLDHLYLEGLVAVQPSRVSVIR